MARITFQPFGAPVPGSPAMPSSEHDCVRRRKVRRFPAVANHMPHAKACVMVLESVSVRNQAFAQMPFLAMPELLAAGANFSGT
jgi:hypothetical protein